MVTNYDHLCLDLIEEKIIELQKTSIDNFDYTPKIEPLIITFNGYERFHVFQASLDITLAYFTRRPPAFRSTDVKIDVLLVQIEPLKRMLSPCVGKDYLGLILENQVIWCETKKLIRFVDEFPRCYYKKGAFLFEFIEDAILFSSALISYTK